MDGGSGDHGELRSIRDDDDMRNGPDEPLLGRSDSQGHDAQRLLDSSGDGALEQSVLRKIDWRLLPLLFTTYMLNFMDKTILSSAAVFGLPEDTNLQGQQYSWVGSIFYVGYLLWEYPTTLLIPKLPVGKYLAVNTLFWGCVVTFTAGCTNFASLFAARFFLGVAEATITPGFMFLTSTWYTRDEMPMRVAIWFSGNSVGGLLSSLFAYAIGHVHDDLHPWRWMYIILGTVTFSWALPLLILLPDSVSKARFLTAEERRVAAKRVVVAGTGSTEIYNWQWDQFRECVIDPKSWLILFIELLTQIPNGGTQNFANIVIESFGFTALQTTLINIPYSLLSAGVIYGTGYLAGHYRNLNCLLVIAVVVPCVTGAAVIYHRKYVPHSLHLLAYFFLLTGPAAMPLIMSLVQSNYRGVTKKMTITAMLFITYCLGNILGPHLFRKSEAPDYETAFATIVVCYVSVIALAILLRVYLEWMNAKRDREQMLQISDAVAGGLLFERNVEDQAGNDAPSDTPSCSGLDTTDWQTAGFRYRL